ncbi:MAG: tetratricopeptide repeat protein [Phycisphaerales bacterium]|nr:MAG: tetratricopeptide repeat protein [Phycisphaerales bacterium]
MPGRRLTIILLALFWLATGVGYVWAGWQQRQRINLSAAAGGQYPYFVYARDVAEKGAGGFFGDRNRMPLYPSLMSLVYDEDWEAFVDASARFAIASSVLVLIGVGVLTYLTLPIWPATALIMTAVVCVFVRNASFVQAELMYYGVLYACWLVLCRVIQKPHPGWAVVGGALVGVAYLTKASGLAILAALVVPVCGGAVLSLHGQDAGKDRREGGAESRGTRSILLSGCIVAIVFLAVAYPYIRNNKARFGRCFYNVNSTFFMWCDSWTEAKSFADEYRASEQYPVADAEDIPGPAKYWREHTAGQILGRLAYGVKTLALLALDAQFFKYFVATAGFCLIGGVRWRRRAASLLREHRLVVVFCVLFFAGYLLAFAWYAQVAYGDRFLLSLFLPGTFCLYWLSDRLWQQGKPWSCCGRSIRALDVFAFVLTACLVAEGVVTITGMLYKPGEEFVRFYYNESRELQIAGNQSEAARGFAGVVQLDPDFAPAHHSLGMIALTSGRFEDAIVSLRTAVRLDLDNADAHNSLGSALFQTGRTDEAVQEFERATELDPFLASAWYNLGGSYCTVGAFDRAEQVRQRLDTLDPRLADQLARMIGERDK